MDSDEQSSLQLNHGSEIKQAICIQFVTHLSVHCGDREKDGRHAKHIEVVHV